MTFIGADASRVELSTTSVENAAAKIANAITDEFGLDGGARIELRLPTHWQRVTWLAGTWTAGCVAVPTEPADASRPDVDLTVTTADALTGRAPAGPTVVVSLHPLGLPTAQRLPAGVEDVTIAVRTQPDAFLGAPPAAADAALLLGADVLDQEQVLALAASRATSWGLAPGGRLLVAPGGDPVDAWLAALAVPLAIEASVVLVDGDHDLDRIAAQEKVTATC